MNNGRLWCVVNPTVGIPLFLGAVALTSLTVHNAILTHTSWIGDYWAGSAKKTALNSTASPSVAMTGGAASDFTVNVEPVANSTAPGGTSFVVTVTPKAPGKVAMATGTAK